MAKKKPSPNATKRKPPKVRIARSAGRPFQLRYMDPDSGKEVRITCGCRDEDTAEAMKKELEAKLLLGVSVTTRKKATRGPRMSWEDFREEYRVTHLSQLRHKSQKDAESRLDIAGRILKPKTLADVVNVDALTRLQTDLLAGKESRSGEPRSPHTVRHHMATIMGSLNWAHTMEWIPAVPKFRKVKTAKLKHAKGRPIALEEFERMLACTEDVVGADAAESWRYVLRGLWTSGLRIDELMHVSWTDDSAIVPVWTRGRLPVLKIPHTMQKNAIEEHIPLMPDFGKLLQETPEGDRTGWVFNPRSLQTKLGRPVRHSRSNAEWISKIICRIGKRAGVVVRTERERKKFASAHDLRRSFAERLYDAGVPERVVTQVLRHSSPETTRKYYAPTNVQTSAGILRELLGECT